MAGRDLRRRPSTEAPGDLADFSCKACSAALLADCVALCCCPCALVGLLATAFLKLPWRVGKRCVRSLRKKRKLRKVRATARKNGKDEEEVGAPGLDQVDLGGEAGEGRRSTSAARSEAEKMWVELHRLGHLGFGRVSSSTPPHAARGTSLAS